jgi:hypothetical protein
MLIPPNPPAFFSTLDRIMIDVYLAAAVVVQEL